MRRPIHRIRAAHGCEHFRYASDPGNKESRSPARSQGPSAASGETPDKAGRLMLLVARDRGRSADSDSPAMSIWLSSDVRGDAGRKVKGRLHRVRGRGGPIEIGNSAREQSACRLNERPCIEPQPLLLESRSQASRSSHRPGPRRTCITAWACDRRRRLERFRRPRRRRDPPSPNPERRRQRPKRRGFHQRPRAGQLQRQPRQPRRPRPLPDRRRELNRRAGRGRCPSRGRTGRARLDADGGLDKGRPRPFYRQLRGKRLVEQL